MKTAIALMILMPVALWSAGALAKLPPPTPEQAVKLQAAAEKKAKDEEATKNALEQARLRVVKRYRAAHKA